LGNTISLRIGLYLFCWLRSEGGQRIAPFVFGEPQLRRPSTQRITTPPIQVNAPPIFGVRNLCSGTGRVTIYSKDLRHTPSGQVRVFLKFGKRTKGWAEHGMLFISLLIMGSLKLVTDGKHDACGSC